MNRKGEPADAELLEEEEEEEDEKEASPAETPRAVGELEGHESRVFKAVFSPIDRSCLMNENVENARVQHARVQHAQEDWHTVLMLINLPLGGEMPRQCARMGRRDFLESDDGRQVRPKHLGLWVNSRETSRAYSRLCSRPLKTRCLLLARKTTRAASGTSLNASSSSASRGIAKRCFL